MKNVFLDDLPRKGIDWENSVGHKVRFIYNDIEGEIEIVGYDGKHLELKYKNDSINMYPDNFTSCKLGSLIGEYSDKHKYDVGEIILDVKSGELKILDQIRIKYKNNQIHKGYKYKCLICGNVDEINQGNIKNKHGCNVCSGQKTLKGYNDIHATDPELGMILWNHDDGYKYTLNSGKRVDFKCPSCSIKIPNKVIAQIKNQGLSCPRCSDGISYPEKIMYNLLKQLNIWFEKEYSPEWGFVAESKNEKVNGRKRYDFYVETLNCIIETHGGQHYEESSRKSTRTLEEEKENDYNKEKKAKENFQGHYIIIRADRSELGYIKENILDSALSDLIDLSSVDWDQVDRDSQKSLVKIACDMWSEGSHTTMTIANSMRISRATVNTYLKKGRKLGWCDYDPKVGKLKIPKK